MVAHRRQWMPFWLPLSTAGERLLKFTVSSRNKLISLLIYSLILNHLKVTLPNPFRRGARGWGTLGQQNHAAGGANSSIMVGMFVSCVLASQKPFSVSFSLPPERT